MRQKIFATAAPRWAPICNGNLSGTALKTIARFFNVLRTEGVSYEDHESAKKNLKFIRL